MKKLDLSYDGTYDGTYDASYDGTYGDFIFVNKNKNCKTLEEYLENGYSFKQANEMIKTKQEFEKLLNEI